MKKFKFFIMFIAALMLSVSTFAADKLERKGTNEVSLAYGQASVGQGVYLFADIFVVLFSLGHATVENPMFTGQLSGEYYNYLNNTIAVGGIVTGEWMGGKTVDQNKPKDDPNYVTGEFNMGFATVMPAMKASWFNYKNVGMYSKLGVGCCLALGGSEGVQPTIGFQVSPVCCDFGNEKWRGFAELGVGMQGTLLLGVKYQF